MKIIILISVLSLLFTTACNDRINLVDQLVITNLDASKMKIIPENPRSADDIKLVVFDDCTYNTLSGITKNGNTIVIEKQFNSMMKWPCFMRNDTIQIGKLSEGTYIVNYKLLDIAIPAKPKITNSIAFELLVSR
ncbi:MAG TPA: hypothetical protein VGK38_00340 [Prolixibacteraceae bacterium]|jgi:hypothetical protein